MEKKLYNLTIPQKSILLTEQYYSNTNINNICGTAILSDKINFNFLEQAINIVIKNNESFRIKFINQNNELQQYIDDYTFQQIEIVKLNSIDEVNNLENTLLHQLYDLEKKTYDFKIFKFPDSTGGFLLNIHHIISDSWTLGLTCRKIMQAYENLLNNIPNQLVEEQSYSQYINTEKQYLNSSKFIKDKEYWENIYSTIPDLTNLPSSRNNSELSFSCQANRVSFILSNTLSDDISAFCSKHKLSPFVFFTTILSIYIFKVTDNNTFVIGTPILNRTSFNEKNTTGMFINISPLLININKDMSFDEFSNQISTNSLSLLRHQRYPYAEILKHIRKRDFTFQNLFNILLSYQVTKANNESTIPYQTRWAFNGTCADDLDIQIYDLDETKNFNISYDYKVDKFTKKDITTMHQQLINIINQIIDNKNIKISDINILSQEEKDHIINDFNNTSVNYDNSKTIIDLFKQQVNTTPNNTAVIFENNKITYKDLDLKSNLIANYLIKHCNIRRGDIVSILLNRSIDLISTILGIIKAGATYIAIDPDYPIDRIKQMLNNSNSKICITNNITQKLITDFQKSIINLNNITLNDSSEPSNINTSEDILYTIYTSGSTGVPKGVLIKHKNVHNFILGMRQIIDFSEVNSLVSVATVCFDMFVFELWGSLLNGLTLILANENEQKLPHLLNKLCCENKVDIFQTTPSRFNLLFDNNETECFKNIKHILVGGEFVSKALFDKFKEYSNINIHHMYGPTETTIWSTHKNITNTNNITIGTPLSNTQVYILNKDKTICPIGVSGEIYISGDGIGAGYLNNTELTSKSFIQNPFVPETLMYKTGDIGFYNSNGEISYVSRSDNQIKIRGYRIELDEIENLILTFPNISNCVVCKKELTKNHEVLCAYFTEKDTINIDELKKYLQKKLPTYMIPQYFTLLLEFPHTLNGKIDYRNLPMPKHSIANTTQNIIRNEYDNKLITLLQIILESTSISINDNLFDLGMDSLIAINLSVKLFNEFNIELNISEIFNNPIIKDLSDYISNKETSNNSNRIKKYDKHDYYPLSTAEQRIYYAASKNTSTAYNISGGIIFNSHPNIEKLSKCINIILNKHDSLKSYFKVENDQLVQKVLDSINYTLESESIDNDNIKELFDKFIQPFDLSIAPLFRAKLIKLKNKKYILMIDTHHIICDGTSLNIFINELCSLYNDSSHSDLTINYTDYILWEENFLKTKKYKENELYWIEQFKDSLPLLNLPTTYSRPAIKTYSGNTIKHKLSSKLSKKILEFSR